MSGESCGMEDSVPVKKVFLIVGGSRGIGAATAVQIAHPDRVVLVNYNESETSAIQVVQNIGSKGGEGHAIAADVSDETAVREMCQAIGDRWGQLEAVVYCASPPVKYARFADTSWPDFEAQWSVQVRGAYNVLKNTIPLLSTAGGQVIFILSSAVLHHPPAQMSAYVTAKYALMGLARSAGVELARDGIRVNMISPYLTPTDAIGELHPRVLEVAEETHPLGRLTTVDDTAAAIDFLLSPGAGYLHLVNIPVSGGIVS